MIDLTRADPRSLGEAIMAFLRAGLSSASYAADQIALAPSAYGVAPFSEDHIGPIERYGDPRTIHQVGPYAASS